MEELACQSQEECSDGHHRCGCTLEESSSSVSRGELIHDLQLPLRSVKLASTQLPPLALTVSDEYVTPCLWRFESLLKCLVHNLYCLFIQSTHGSPGCLIVHGYEPK